jgi:predicted metal-dependent hydrolase
VNKKARWIAEKQELVKGFVTEQGKFSFSDGDSLLFLGKTHGLLKEDTKAITVGDDTIHIPAGTTVAAFVEWLRSEAKTVITPRVKHYAALMGVRYESIKISNAKKRWGSCSSKNALNFAWRLVMCPPSVIEYVVVHELSHITHKNHSAEFWGSVSEVLPEYKEARAWQRANQHLMDVI